MSVILEQQKQRSKEFLEQRHKLMAYLLGLVGDPHVAEDIFQEIWMRLAAYQKDDIVNTSAWCRGVGKNLVLHHWREKGNQKLNINSNLLEKVDQAFEEDDDFDSGHCEKKDALNKCVGELPQHSKNLLNLKYSEGYSFKQLSTQFDKSENALMMSLSRIRKKLQLCVEQRLKKEGVVV